MRNFLLKYGLMNWKMEKGNNSSPSFFCFYKVIDSNRSLMVSNYGVLIIKNKIKER